MNALTKFLAITLIIASIPATLLQIPASNISETNKEITVVKEQIETAQYTNKVKLQQNLHDLHGELFLGWLAFIIIFLLTLAVPLFKAGRALLFAHGADNPQFYWIKNMEDLGALRAKSDMKFVGVSALFPWYISNIRHAPPYKTKRVLRTNSDETVLICGIAPRRFPFMPDSVELDYTYQEARHSTHSFPFMMMAWGEEEVTVQDKRTIKLKQQYKQGENRRLMLAEPASMKEDGIEFADVIEEEEDEISELKSQFLAELELRKQEHASNISIQRGQGGLL